MKKAIGIDIGGTKIAGGLIDEKGNLTSIVKELSKPNDREGMFEAVCLVIDEVMRLAEVSQNEIAIGLGVPGLLDRENGIALFQNNLNWKNFPVIARVKERYPNVLGVAMDNDVYQAARAEWHHAQMEPEELMVYLTISTGIACAIRNGGGFIRGQGFAGELGLVPFKEDGKDFRSLEQTLAGPAIELKGQEIYHDETITTAAVFERYQKGDRIAQQIIKDWEKEMARGIYTLVSILDPNKIIFGGSVLLMNPDILAELKEELAGFLLPVQNHALAALTLSPHPNTAGILGAGLQGIEIQ